MHETQGDWLPARAALHPTGLYFSLREIEPAELQDAFMQQTLARVSARERFVQIAREDLGKGTDGCAPAGLIFHVARCGSTLVSQLLKQLGLVVYAEPLPVNEILVPPHGWSRVELVGALRSLGAAFARHAQKPYVLKFTSWNTLFCDIVTEAFPQSPWVLSYRDPVEVGVSLLNRPPGWLWDESTKPSSVFSGFIDPENASTSREEYVARLYGAFCRAASRLDTGRSRLVPYASLPGAVWESVAPHFSLAPDSGQQLRMAQAARADAKAPLGKAAAFTSDIAAKQAAASSELRQAIATFATPRLAELEKLHAL